MEESVSETRVERVKRVCNQLLLEISNCPLGRHELFGGGKLVFLEGCPQDNLKLLEIILFDFIFLFCSMKCLNTSIKQYKQRCSMILATFWDFKQNDTGM